jgi:hypothetical protein
MQTMKRDNEFFDTLEGHGDVPAAAITLGWELVSVDPDEGTIEVAFTADERFLNPAGAVQGGFVAAMLDDTLGPALVATLGEGTVRPDGRPSCAVPAPGPAGQAYRQRPDRAAREEHRVPGWRTV